MFEIARRRIEAYMGRDDFLIKILTLLGFVFFVITGVNFCFSSDWNNGICQNCEVRYELRGMSNGLKAYACPKCGKEVYRY